MRHSQQNKAWPRLALGAVVKKITKGTTPTTVGGVFSDQGIRFIKVEAIGEDGRLNDSKIVFIDSRSDQLLSRSRLEQGDVLFSIAGAIGRTYLVQQDDLPANVNQALAIIRPDSTRLSSSFCYYAMRNARFQQEALGRVVQCAQANVNLKQMALSEIPVPSMGVQQRIASILSAYDDLIANNRRRIQLLEDAARLLYREWFVRLRFPGHEHAKIRGGVPDGWEKVPLAKLAEVNRASLGQHFQGEIDYIDISAVSPGHIEQTTTHEFSAAPSRARRVVQHGDIIWSCVRPNRRSHAVIWHPQENLIASTGFAVITPTAVPTSFLYQAVTTDDFVGRLVANARGVAYPAVTAPVFESAQILAPPGALLAQYNEQAEPMLEQISILRQQTQRLARARDLLLPKLMNGEVAV
ncbi:MAG TPA: restriction endonuclease subunit S [Kiritimatiellia bacterium]|nr:restriction endonuclease subunit S [Kiritimatiellia bacterium]HQG74185.1 restriction endonuclease subunit S [Kiritimatiellia bacterium]